MVGFFSGMEKAAAAAVGHFQPGPRVQHQIHSPKRAPVSPSMISGSMLGTRFLSKQNDIAKSIALRAASGRR